MKTLYLLRHAEAETKTVQPDYKRELTEKGKKEAEATGQWLASKGLRPDCVYSSHAHRAVQTAEKVAGAIDFPIKDIQTERDLYSTDPEVLMDFVRNVKPEHNSVMIAGHNPEISQITVKMANEVARHLPTGGIAIFQFDVDDWSEVDEADAEFLHWFAPRLEKEG